MGNPVCLWQTELFKLNLKSSPSSSGYNRRRRLAPRSSRKQQAERTSVRAAPIVCPEESPLLATIGDNFAVSKSSLVGIDAPTPARGQGLQPYGALTLFFRWRKKSVQKKASGTATPEAAHVAMRRGLRSAGALRAVLDLGSLRSPAGKKASIAHFDGGARNVARNEAGQLTHTGGARSCSPFSAAKMGGPFSLRCLSPLCSGAVGVGQAYPLRGGMLSCGLGIFATQKASVKLKSRWPVL